MIWHSDTDHQVLFVVVQVPITHTTNKRWRTAAILKIVKLPYLSHELTNRTTFGMMTHIKLSNLIGR